jgi:hypothetical protein
MLWVQSSQLQDALFIGGGYVELINLDPQVMVQFKKMISAKLCSTVIGQVGFLAKL